MKHRISIKSKCMKHKLLCVYMPVSMYSHTHTHKSGFSEAKAVLVLLDLLFLWQLTECPSFEDGIIFYLVALQCPGV